MVGAQVEGYPTILMFPAVPEGAVGEKPDPISYEGDQTLISLTRFIKSHATVRAHAVGHVRDMFGRCCWVRVSGGSWRERS